MLHSTICRIYYFKAGSPVTTHEGPNEVRMLGGNMGWTDVGSPEYHVKLRNLSAAHCVFTSECLGERTIDEVVGRLLGATYPAGQYEF